jgi:hypothetical protein
MLKLDGPKSHKFCKAEILPEAGDMVTLWQQLLSQRTGLNLDN